MSGISSSTGLISGIDSAGIIDQLLSIEARPRTLVQRRIGELQRQQAAILDLNSRLGGLRTIAESFARNRVFSARTASSSNQDVLSATASNNAAAGTYTFLVDRGVSTQQQLSRAFADRNSVSVGLTGVVVEPQGARLDSDTDLSQLNGGLGLSRGKIVITDRGGTSATVDLSRVASVREVLAAINNNGTARVRASVSGGKFVLTDESGSTSTALSVRSAAGYSTAESLGLTTTASGGTLTGTDVYTIGNGTTLASLRDGSGVRLNSAAGTASFDFTIRTRDGGSFNIDISDLYDSQGAKTAGPVATVEQLKQRIAEQTGNRVTLSVRADGRGFALTDTSTGSSTFEVPAGAGSGAAEDLGLVGAATGGAGLITGSAVLAGLNTTLASSLNAGNPPRDNTITINARNGTDFNLTIDTSGSVDDIIQAINTGTGGAVTVELSSRGNGLVVRDRTGSTAENLIITGGLAEALGIDTEPAGVASATLSGDRVERQYVSAATRVSTLNGNTGIGTGTFEIIGAGGVRGRITIGAEVRSVADLLNAINGQKSTTGVIARINDSGSGILLEEENPGAGGSRIEVRDTAGSVARNLNIAGTASGTGLANRIDGSFRRTITLAAGDTLDQVVGKVNEARAGLNANIVTDGTSATPFRLRLTSTLAGSDGRLIVETTGADPGLTTIAEGSNARVFFGSEDPARSILVSRNTNALDGLVDGLRLDVRSSNANPVTVTVSQDSASIEKAVNDFAKSFNELVSRIQESTTFNRETEVRGPLLGESTANSLRLELFQTVSGRPLGVSGRYQNLSQIGVTVGTGGQLRVDSAKLREALATDAQAVADLVGAKVIADRPNTVPVSGQPGVSTPNTAPVQYTSLGIAERVVRVAEKYLDSVNGQLTGRSRAIEETIRRNNDRISDFDRRLATRRATLERQFAGLESTLAQLQRQQSALTRINPQTTTQAR